MWIFTGASLIWSAWMSVLTATNSTCVMPASIIRFTALMPAPPTPMTLITARSAPASAAAAVERLSIGGASGIGACTGSGARGAGAGSGSGSGSGSPSAAASSSSQLGTCSTVRSSGSAGTSGCGATAVSSMVCCAGASLAAGVSPGVSPRCSACFCAASVALNSSASGPSRMLARRRAIEHLLRQVTVHRGGLAARVVLEDRLPLHRRLRVTHRLADLRVEHEVAEVLLQDLDRLARVEEPPVEHRREDALDTDVRVEVLADHRERVLELDEPAQREVLALDGDDHAVCGDERVDRQQAERRRRVDEDPVVALPHGQDRLLERPLPPDHGGEGELGTGEVDRGDGDVELVRPHNLRDRQPVAEDVEHRAVDLVGVPALRHRQVPLRVEVDQEHAHALLGERPPEVEGGRRLRDSTLLVGKGDYPSHRRTV